MKLPALIVILAGLTFGLQHVGTYYGLGPQREVFVSAFPVLFVAGFVEPIVLWLIVTIVAYVIARLLGAELLIGRLFRLGGWGFIPFMFTGLAWTVGRYVVFGSATIPDFNEGVLEQELNAYGAMVAQHSGPLIAVFLAGSVFFIASIYLWVHAMKKSGSIETRTAVIATVVPMVAYVLFRIQDIGGF